MEAQKYAGADWVAEIIKTPLSPLGVAVANLLGDVFLGIYHIDTKQLREADWSDAEFVAVPINARLCTVDFDHLTRLLVLAHDRMIRVDITGRWSGWLTLMFHQRHKRDGHTFERYPTLEEHAAMLRKHYGEPTP